MRIISGIFKSRKIHSPAAGKNKRGGEIRPTSDRARETIFDILNSRFDLTGCSCLDLFSGTGAYGFECLSRGAAFVSFVDLSKVAADLIKKTSGELGVEDKVVVTRSDAIKFLKENKIETDVIFADPPYDYKLLNEFSERVFDNDFKIFVLEAGEQKDINYETKIYDCIERRVGEAFFKIFINKQI